MKRPAFTLLGAVFSSLGAVFRKLKTGLFIARDRHWLNGEKSSGSAFYPFAFLLYYFSS